VVATIEEHAFWAEDFVGVEEERNLCRPRASIDKVAVEEVAVCGRWKAVKSEEFEEVEELS
jgi:hypothetical protein